MKKIILLLIVICVTIFTHAQTTSNILAQDSSHRLFTYFRYDTLVEVKGLEVTVQISSMTNVMNRYLLDIPQMVNQGPLAHSTLIDYGEILRYPVKRDSVIESTGYVPSAELFKKAWTYGKSTDTLPSQSLEIKSLWLDRKRYTYTNIATITKETPGFTVTHTQTVTPESLTQKLCEWILLSFVFFLPCSILIVRKLRKEKNLLEKIWLWLLLTGISLVLNFLIGLNYILPTNTEALEIEGTQRAVIFTGIIPVSMLFVLLAMGIYYFLQRKKRPA